MRTGVLSLGDLIRDPVSGVLRTPAQRHRNLIDQAVWAEAAGFDSIHFGEHHFSRYIMSAPQVVLAAVAERTSRLRLSTGVTLAANLDPVRVAEDYATVDAISNGRVEPCFGRGTLFPDVYTEFGQDEPLAKERFAESLELIHRLWTEEDVTWSGRFRPDLHSVTVHPRPTQQPRPPMWVGAGVSIDSVELAARLGCWLMLPTVFGTWEMFRPAVDHYCEAWERHGHDPRDRRIGAISHFCVARTSQEAHARFAPRYQTYFDQLMDWRAESAARAGASLFPFPREPYETMVQTIAICGSPAEVLDRFAVAREMLRLDTHLVMTDMGGMPDDDIRRTFDVLASDVLPVLRAA